jgi:regulator of protease activity HflC (stomatin/prohibitin superfamily)
MIVRATEGGVKWSLWRSPREIKPGFRVYWPLISDVEVITIARQSVNTPAQALETKDGVQVIVGGVIIYRINDILKAMGEKNSDPDDTAIDIAQSALLHAVTTHTHAELMAGIAGDIEKGLTEKCKKDLKQYGVLPTRVAFTDFCTTQSLNHSGINIEVSTAE